jgi:hypothetical protein
MSDDPALSQDEYAAEYPYGPQPSVIKLADYVDDQDSKPRWFLTNKGGRGLIGLAGIGLVFAVSNLVVCPLLEMIGRSNWSALPALILMGAVLAEGGLLSTILVFSDGSFWWRAAGCWLAGLFLWVCWAVGLAWASARGPQGYLGECLQLGGLSLPLAALAVQSPLWFARTYSGWRLAKRQVRATSGLPLSIGDCFVGTAVVAISFALARLARPAGWSPVEYWRGWSIIFPCFACGSLLSVVPAILLTFRVRSWPLAFGLLMLYALVVATLAVYVVNAVAPGGRPQAFENVSLMTMFLSLAVFMGAGMQVVRDCGYSLVIGRNKNEQTVR